MSEFDILKNFFNEMISKLDDETIDNDLLNEFKIFFINTKLKPNSDDKELIDCMFYGFYIKNLIKKNNT